MDIKQYILSDFRMAIKVLEYVGYIFRSDDGKNLKFAFDGYSNGSCFYNKENGYFKRWSNNTGGSIIDAVMWKTNYDFKTSVKLIKEILSIDNSTLSKHFVNNPTPMPRVHVEYKANDIDISNYDCIFSDMFLDDNIGRFTHDFFDIRVNDIGDRICIPWREDNKVVGMLGRINQRKLDEYYRFKYITLEKFKKSSHVYGLFENEEFIAFHGKAHIFESEKSVQQCFEMGFRTAIAMGSSSLSQEQMKKLHKAGANEFYLMFDEGSNEENIFNTVELIKYHTDNKVKVYVVYDKDGEVLKKGSKNSPSDIGYKMYELLNKFCFEM